MKSIATPNVLFASIVMISLVCPAAARAEFVYNMELGLAWEYDDLLGDHERQEVIRLDNFRGVEIKVVGYSESPYNDGLENFWSESESGDLLLWGFDRTHEDVGYVYDPPLVWVDEPLYPGKEWTQNFSIYTYPDHAYVGQGHYTFVVKSAGDVEVPYGTFPAFEVEGTGAMDWDQPLPLSACGLRNVTIRTTDWWSDGVGRIRYDSGQLSFRLSDLVQPTAVRETSWGRIKALFP
jgi:hypothetical protein